MATSMSNVLTRSIRQALYFAALTCTLGGLQTIFAIVMALVSPYLLSLGYSKPAMALVWLAGPIFGVFVQPYYGLCSDRSRIAWGKRRPYILGGALGITVGLLALAWAKDIVHTTAFVIQGSIDRKSVRIPTLVAAAAFLWTVIFSVQPLQAAIRALIVDSCTTEQMNTSNAWASRMVGMGSLLGYFVQYMDLSSWLPEANNAQFKMLCLISSALLVITVTICCVFIHEEDPSLEKQNISTSSSFGKIVEMCRSMFKLSPEVRSICAVQLCSWFGWYCFMFYSTTYIGEIYLQYEHESTPGTNPNKLEVFRETANRQGSLAFLVYSIVNMATTILAPMLIAYQARFLSIKPRSKFLAFLQRQLGTTFARLRAAWMFSECLFAFSMFSTFFICSVNGAKAMVSVIGISAALSQQTVPFTLISIILSRYKRESDPESGIDSGTRDDSKYETRPGIVMGLHNVAIAAPQLLASLVSSVIFSFGNNDPTTEPGKEGLAVGDSASTAWALRAGGVAALLATYMVSRIVISDDGENQKIQVDGQDDMWLDTPEKKLSDHDEEASGLLDSFDSRSSLDTSQGMNL